MLNAVHAVHAVRWAFFCPCSFVRGRAGAVQVGAGALVSSLGTMAEHAVRAVHAALTACCALPRAALRAAHALARKTFFALPHRENFLGGFLGGLWGGFPASWEGAGGRAGQRPAGALGRLRGSHQKAFLQPISLFGPEPAWTPNSRPAAGQRASVQPQHTAHSPSSDRHPHCLPLSLPFNTAYLPARLPACLPTY